MTNEDQKRLDEISASITHYYGSMSEEEEAENRAWGEFASRQLGLCWDAPFVPGSGNPQKN